MSEPLLEEVSPAGNVLACVEAEYGVCFFYLRGEPDADFGMRAVWVRNLATAPSSMDRERLAAGLAPLNPEAYCRERAAQEPPRAEELRVVWLPEGDGAALLERDEVIAIIPPWSGHDDCHGYARDCVGTGPLAWELQPDNAMLPRIAEAQAYWEWWSDPSSWSAFQTSAVAHLEASLGPHSNYYAIDGGRWPPKALLRIPAEVGTILVTIGVSLRPQPTVEMYTDTPRDWRRIELGAVVPRDWSEESVRGLAGYLSGQSSLPWTDFTWLGDGHTLPCNAWRNPRFTAAVLSRTHPAVSIEPPPDQFGDPVTVLWLLPITEGERSDAVAGASALDAGRAQRRWLDA